MNEKNEEYIKKGGLACPSCGSSDLEGGEMSTDVGMAWQQINCCGCQKTWTDQYTLTSISE